MRYSVTLFVRAAGVRHPSPSRSSAGVMAAAPGHAGNGNMAVTCEILVHQSDPPLRGALSDILRLVIRPQSAGSVIMAPIFLEPRFSATQPSRCRGMRPQATRFIAFARNFPFSSFQTLNELQLLIRVLVYLLRGMTIVYCITDGYRIR